MKRLVVLALALAGCGEEAGEMYPIHPGGGGGAGGTFRNDGGMDAGDDGGGPISGRVCVIASNLRSVASTCASTGAQDLTVVLGTETAMTSADGSFTIPRPTTTDLYWSITASTASTVIQPALVRFGTTFGAGGATLLPAFDRTAYLDMVDTNQAAYDDGTGGLVVRVTSGGVAVVGATVATTPAASSAIYYDAGNDSAWAVDAATGDEGVAWIPSIQGTSAQIDVTSGTTSKTFTQVRLEAGALTFVAADIP